VEKNISTLIEERHKQINQHKFDELYKYGCKLICDKLRPKRDFFVEATMLTQEYEKAEEEVVSAIYKIMKEKSGFNNLPFTEEVREKLLDYIVAKRDGNSFLDIFEDMREFCEIFKTN